VAKYKKIGWLTKRPGKPHIYFGVKISGRRYFKSTGKTTERAAEGERERCHAEILKDIEAEKLAGIRTAERPLETFGEAANFYWVNVGQWHDGGTPEKMSVGSGNTFWSLTWLKAQIGADTKLEVIDGGVVQQVKAARRGMASRNSKRGEPKPVSAATINRSAIQPLRKVLLYARENGHAKIAKIDWSVKASVLMEEPVERVRELEPDEEIRLFENLREDYQTLVDVAIIVGLRQAEAILKLRWHMIGWGTMTITVPGKGNRTDVMQLPTAARDLLWAYKAKVRPERDDELVFSYVAERTVQPSSNAKRTMNRTRIKGQRYPITKSGLRRAFTNAIRAAGIADFRYHDLRHTFATRLLRESDLRQVQKQGRWRQLKTVEKYAHVRDLDMRASMDRAASASPRRGAVGGATVEGDANRGHPRGHPKVG
jgi:integrase